MAGFIVSFIIGIILIVLGVVQYRGNISSLHSYHRNRVSKEDVKPMGKLVGIGTLIIGIGLCLSGIFNAVAIIVEIQTFSVVGMILLGVSLTVGIIINFYAIIKYNKGLF
ncbi:MAG: hypothetical protein E7358_05395 [Clostridiales bacterium]|nr:hypothetical protein [Clostridiales bacterium]